MRTYRPTCTQASIHAIPGRPTRPSGLDDFVLKDGGIR